MAEVVAFKRREPLVWVCICGCSTFKLYEGGATECAACGTIGIEGGEWVNELPEPEGPAKDALPNSKVISFGDASPAVALRAMLQRINAEKLVALVALETNGRVRTWGGIDTDERKKWLRRRLKEAFDLLTMLAKPSRLSDG